MYQNSFLALAAGGLGEVGVSTFWENGDLKQEYLPRGFTLMALDPLESTPQPPCDGLLEPIAHRRRYRASYRRGWHSQR